VLALAPGLQDPRGDGNPNVNGARERSFKAKVAAALGGVSYGASPSPPMTGSTPQPEPGVDLLDTAFRLLADIADDGKLSAAEGKPALAALLAAQRESGAIAEDVGVHAVATWALAEAAGIAPGEALADARTKASDYLVHLAQPAGWPARPGGAIDAEATRWARLVLGWMAPAAVRSIPSPSGEPSKRFAQLRAALAAARSGAAAPGVAGASPFERFVRAIGRGHLKVVRV
jgi:hypothetical protein